MYAEKEIYKMNNIIDLLKFYLEKFVKKNGVFVDMTCGNGHDTERLLKEYSPKFLYSFDIQEKAREKTFERLGIKSDDEISNFKFILDNHANLKSYIKEKVDLAIYNLGYLPSGDKTITTNSNDVISSFSSLINLLNDGAFVFMTLYTGFEQGKQEAEKVLSYLENLPQREFNIIKHEFINQKNNPPCFVAIEKR